MLFNELQWFDSLSFIVLFECAACTNSEFTKDAIELATANKVKLWSKPWIEKKLAEHNIYHATVSKMLLQRMEKV